MKANLSSNSGRAYLEIAFAQREQLGDGVWFDTDVTVQVPNWSGDEPVPCCVAIAGLRLKASALAEMTAAIEAWVELPLAAMAEFDFKGSFELAGRLGERLCLCFGPRTDTIASRHPVVTISIAGPLHAELHFVTDQSCLEAFAAAIDALTDLLAMKM